MVRTRQKDVADAGALPEQAAELRRRAESSDDNQIRRNFIKIAEQYEQLADAIDRRSGSARLTPHGEPPPLPQPQRPAPATGDDETED